MIGYAAAGDTWGIPGPVFLLAFLAAAVLIVIGSAVHRRRLFAGPDRLHLNQLGAQQAAYLSGGERLAVYASLSGLRGAGALAVGPDRALVQTAPMPPGATPLDQAVYNAAGKRLQARTLVHDQWVRGALDQLGDELRRTGLAPSDEARRGARAGGWLLFALAGVGVARIAAGASNGRPIGFLLLAEAAALVAAVVLLVRVPRHTDAARRALLTLRQRHAHLAPRHRPAMSTYGPHGAAMGVALFGAATLWAMDPSFATAADIEHRSSLGGGSGYYGGGGGDSGGGDSGGGGGGCGGGGGGGGGGGCGG